MASRPIWIVQMLLDRQAVLGVFGSLSIVTLAIEEQPILAGCARQSAFIVQRQLQLMTIVEHLFGALQVAALDGNARQMEKRLGLQG